MASAGDAQVEGRGPQKEIKIPPRSEQRVSLLFFVPFLLLG